MNNHFKHLEQMYLAAPINELYKPTISISKGHCVIEMEVNPHFFHAANALHGSVYFKKLDDAAFFAANSVIEDVFVLTGTFTTRLIRPVNEGKLIAKGELIEQDDNRLIAKSKLFNNKKLVATGEGVFIKSKMALNNLEGYA